jgi:hypothetical protein
MASGFGRTTCSAHGAPRLAALARQADRLTVKLAKALCHYRRPISLDARVQRTMLSGFLLKAQRFCVAAVQPSSGVNPAGLRRA